MRFPEAQVVAHATGFDMVLLRFDADRGVSFDVLRRGSERWLCRYLAWRRRDGDLWLIPTAGEGPFIRASAWSLEQLATPPFGTGGTRGRDHPRHRCSLIRGEPMIMKKAPSKTSKPKTVAKTMAPMVDTTTLEAATLKCFGKGDADHAGF